MDIVQMTIRLDSDFHKACLEKSDAAGQTLAEWIRRAMKEKLERENTVMFLDSDGKPISKANEEELAEIIKKVINSMKKEGTI